MPGIATAKASFSWLRPVITALLLCLLITATSRLGLVLWQWDRVDATGGLGFLLLQGLRFDLVTLGLLLGLPIAFTPVAITIPRGHRVWPRILLVLFLAAIAFLLFMEMATPSFVAQYDTRPNILFVEYLNHPREVFSMLWVAYKFQFLLAAVAIPTALLLSGRVLGRAFESVRPTPILGAILLTPLLLLLAVAAVRSTLDHRPVNPSTVAFSTDPMVNTLALNSSYSVLYAIYEMGYEDAEFAYGPVNPEQVIREVRASMGIAAGEFGSDDIPTLHQQQATRIYERPKNLVIVLEESLGAEFVGSMGGPPLTPNLDRLAQQGMWFERLYATGTRSIRGLEAVITGFWPSTSGSVVKLGNSQRDFFTLGQILDRAGYDTSFIYGGDAQFDNMRRFFANNGFDTIVDKRDFVDPEFYGSWGVADEDVFDLAAKRFSSRSGDRPFFSLIFTTTNHSPYEFPDGRIELYEQPTNTVNNAVKYADYALGKFFAQARASTYWDDTVFLIVADHNSRVYGADLVPVERFHIPGLILGGSIGPSRLKRIASQIDLAPTLLSLIGVSAEHPAVGLDLTRKDIDDLPGRAVMQYGGTQGYLENDQIVILRKDMPPRQYAYDGANMTDVAEQPELVAKALNLSAWPWLAYTQRHYRLPARSVSDSTAPDGSVPIVVGSAR